MNRIAALGALSLVLLAGCGSGGEGTTTSDGRTSAVQPSGEDRESAPPIAAPLTPSHCPPGLPSCRTTEGRIRYVERVDPDGDGDAHFVLADPQGITVRGLTFVDVRKGLRPHPLPGIGDRISAAGPVQTGSYGQSQIHAIELHVAGE